MNYIKQEEKLWLLFLLISCYFLSRPCTYLSAPQLIDPEGDFCSLSCRDYPGIRDRARWPTLYQ